MMLEKKHENNMFRKMIYENNIFPCMSDMTKEPWGQITNSRRINNHSFSNLLSLGSQ
uniref:Uncharacterized protein n=1 Tax=Rhizophora mucronata TaxID=61149 RepID=A0A2P2JLD4_RHIMU